MVLHFDSEQLRIMDWRSSSGDIAAVVGPPGCGKTTVGSALAVRMIARDIANRVLLVAYTNTAVNEFGRELCNILGPHTAQRWCLRTGNPAGIDPSIPIPFSVQADDIRSRRIILCTTLSLKRLTSVMRFDNMIIDEAGIKKLQHLLLPFQYGINHMVSSSQIYQSDIANTIDNVMDLASHYGIVATVVGDPKQSKPIGLSYYDNSAIEWVIKKARSDTLHITHRLPDRLSGLVNEFANYGGLISAEEVASRRLSLQHLPDVEYRNIIDPSEVITWVDINNGREEAIGPTSWANETEARACAKICYHLRRITRRKSIVIITRFTAQRMYISDYLYRIGLDKDIKVSTTTGALGTQADITIFSLVRNNPERQVGAAGTLQDLNVSISRSKEKLIIVGNFDMMLYGWTSLPNQTKHGYKSPARILARLVDTKYGKVIDAPKILVR
jgi:energy-coupling factor transporter ATP-binding protein EcfA2